MAFSVSISPHERAEQDIGAIMRLVCLALLPAYGWAALRFGYRALLVGAVCVAAAVLAEALAQRLRGVKVTVADGSAAVTGLLLAAMLPPNISLWPVVLGAAFAILIGKQAFGGLGHNIWNPACLARAFLQISFGSEMNAGPWPSVASALPPGTRLTTGLWGTFPELAARPDVVSSATVLSQIHRPAAVSAAPEALRAAVSADWAAVRETWLGLEGGCLGEVSAVLLLLGGLLLLARRVVTWEIPLPFLAATALLTWLLPAPVRVGSETLWTAWGDGPWLLHLGAGGLMIGAFFMATDMVTSPISRTGRLIFGLGCGGLTAIIRLYAGYPEGVCYAILIMNTCVPLIDAWTRPRKFGAAGKTAAAP